MIYHDFYETRTNLKREKEDQETIKRLEYTGLQLPGDISTRMLWLLASRLNADRQDLKDLPSSLINWNRSIHQEPRIQRKRLDRAFNRLQLVVDPGYHLVTVFQIGSLDKETADLLPLAACREFKWMYPNTQSVRSTPDPDLLFRQIGGYEAELVFGIVGWDG